MRDITLNRIPVLTWRWLKMNETAVSIPSETGSANIKVLNENANNELSKDIIEAMKALPTGMGANMTELCDSESEDIIINTLAGEKSNSHINICRDKESLAKVRVYIYMRLKAAKPMYGWITLQMRRMQVLWRYRHSFLQRKMQR